MKRLLTIFCGILFFVCLCSGCSMFPEQEGLITFSLEETPESESVWNYFIEPEGSVRKVRDEISEDEGGRILHEWVFEGVTAGEVTVTFQYAHEDYDPERTVRYSCIVDENLFVSLLGTEDSADMVGTAEDELLQSSVSTIIALQFGQGLQYPSEQVENAYASEFLISYVNLFCSEYADGQFIALSKQEVEELLNVAFGNRFRIDQLAVDDQNIRTKGDRYQFAVKETVAIAAVPVGDAAEQLQYVFTVTGGEETIDGSAQVTVTTSNDNAAGLSITNVTAQKNA